MMRDPGTNAAGEPFDKIVIDKVWAKGESVWGMESIRKDMYGVPICRFRYGKEEKKGWEIDHIMPLDKGGTDDLSNLQPLFWENNRSKGNKILKAGHDDSCISVIIE